MYRRQENHKKQKENSERPRNTRTSLHSNSSQKSPSGPDLAHDHGANVGHKAIPAERTSDGEAGAAATRCGCVRIVDLELGRHEVIDEIDLRAKHIDQ